MSQQRLQQHDVDDSPALVESVVQHAQNLPATQPAPSSNDPHRLLGGGKMADIVLWRDKRLSAAILAGATAIWILFEWFECHLLSVVSLAFLIIIAVLFVWSNAAALVKRPPPPVPKVRLSDDLVIHAAATVKDEINRFITILHEVALGKDMKLFVKIELSLWLLSVVGSWCDFLTLVYIAIVLALTIPALYERYEDRIESHLQAALQKAQQLYHKYHEKVLRKVTEREKKNR